VTLASAVVPGAPRHGRTTVGPPGRGGRPRSRRRERRSGRDAGVYAGKCYDRRCATQRKLERRQQVFDGNGERGGGRGVTGRNDVDEGMVTHRCCGTPSPFRSGRQRSPIIFMGWFTTGDVAPTAASPVSAARRPCGPPNRARKPAVMNHGLEKLAKPDTRLSGSSSSGVHNRATER
jgi:hypothetical protein